MPNSVPAIKNQHFKIQHSIFFLPLSAINQNPMIPSTLQKSKIDIRYSIFFLLLLLHLQPMAPFPLSPFSFPLSALNFSLYGSIYSQPYWADCQNIIRSLPGWINVSYLGPLDSEEVPEKLSQAHFLFMPTRGENYGHVILESLSAGCPVIISDQTPWRNLHEKGIGWNIQILR